MKRTTLILILLIAFFIVSGITLFFATYVINKPLQVTTIYTDVILVEGNLLGFDINNTALRFGHVPISGIGKKTINLTNDYYHPVRLKIYATGNISPFIKMDNYDYVLSPGEKVNHTVMLSGAGGTEGFYEGYLAFAFYRESFFLP
ncbi:MAG: hypothetical protein ABIJ21_01140 [Nanoarchaeota archaeon]